MTLADIGAAGIQISSKIETLADIGGAGFQISSKIGAGKVQHLYVNWLGTYYKIAVKIMNVSLKQLPNLT